MIVMNKNERLGPNSDLLRTFQAVAAAGNVTRAASELGRTQSAISVQIRKLEEHLAIRLFERGARGVVLTDDGSKLLPVALKVLEEVDRVATLFSEPLAGRVRVGIPDDYAQTILERALAQFAKRHGHVEVFARSGCSAGFPDAIRRNELDLAIYSAGPMPDDEIFYSEPTVWAANDQFEPKECELIPLALFDRDCWWRNVATDALDQAAMPWRVAYLSENFVSVKAAITAGLGVGILAKSALEPAMKVLESSDGFPGLPDTSLSLLKSEDAQSDIVQEMELAIRAAIVK